MIIAQGVPMATSFSLISISLPTPFAKHEVEALLDCSFKKEIEKAVYHQYRETFLVYTQFNVLSFIITPLKNKLKNQLAYRTFGCLKKFATF